MGQEILHLPGDLCEYVDVTFLPSLISPIYPSRELNLAESAQDTRVGRARLPISHLPARRLGLLERLPSSKPERLG